MARPKQEIPPKTYLCPTCAGTLQAVRFCIDTGPIWKCYWCPVCQQPWKTSYLRSLAKEKEVKGRWTP